MTNKLNIWRFQTILSRRLLIWSAASVLAGLLLFLPSRGFWQGFGIQALAWGAIDGMIAGFGLWRSRKRLSSDAGADDPKLLEAESRKFRRLLWINTGLDLLYVVGGIVLAASLGRGNPLWRGHGWGVVLQGAFLFFFDLIHAQSVPPASLSQPLRAFEGPAHRPFFLAGGTAAALFVHGFPGTPAEMRPLAERLHEEGWTVQGILLPGFGSRLSEIVDRGYADWREAVGGALHTLQQEHHPVLLVGYSLGGALSLQAAARFHPDGLVLLCPFWRLGTPLQRLVGRLLQPFLPRYFRPLQKAELDDPRLQQSLREFFPDIDANDPQARAWLRDLQVPISVIRQIMKSGREGYRSARSVAAPMLVVQGREDELVSPRNTQKLIQRLAAPSRAPESRVPGSQVPASGSAGSQATPTRSAASQAAAPELAVPRYLEIPGGHNIIVRGEPGWAELEGALVEFARSIRHDLKARA
jgi:esterase/lipase